MDSKRKTFFQVTTVRVQGKDGALHEQRQNRIKKGGAEVTLNKSLKSSRGVQDTPGSEDTVLSPQLGDISTTALLHHSTQKAQRRLRNEAGWEDWVGASTL